jgi:hypothetical protein
MNVQKYDRISKLSNTQFKRCTGVIRFVFDMMVLLVNSYNEQEKKKVGRPCNLSIEDQLLMTLEYYRENRTFFHLGLSYGLDESNAFRTIARIEKILLESGYFNLPGKKLLLSNAQIKRIQTDVTETPAMRPKKKRRHGKPVSRSSRQRRKYSGKKKRHTHKIQVIMDADRKRIICVHVGKGSEHDFHLYKNSRLHIHPDIEQEVDSGYLGIRKLHSNSTLPFKNTKKHKLTKEQKKKNRLHASRRISIEHKNSQLKVFKLLENRYRSHRKFGLRVTLIASFINANAA